MRPRRGGRWGERDRAARVGAGGHRRSALSDGDRVGLAGLGGAADDLARVFLDAGVDLRSP
jgi:hypothetical protein